MERNFTHKQNKQHDLENYCYSVFVNKQNNNLFCTLLQNFINSFIKPVFNSYTKFEQILKSLN